ncbi:proline/serine-rich coiled-coil protein 1 isoform X2 [Erythrolamprus reginae]|uniref:proline/serine-rich coiled-coil protein 1 isoform X2 n=1 Tax=Erythrolamprus reginae TaxID=121349 RepID=UPI00396C36CA
MESSKDIKFIADETLDFELFSPLDGQEEGESVTCPVELSDKSVAQTVDLNPLLEQYDGRAKKSTPQWSPLTPMKLEEVMKEANQLAMQLEKCQLLEKKKSSETKLGTVLEHECLSPVRFLCTKTKSTRRRTFNVKDSPLQALLPTVDPITCLAQGSPKTLVSKDESSSSRLVDLPSPRRCQNTSYICSPDVPQAKISEPKALKTMTSGNKQLQATIRDNRTEKVLVLPTTTKGPQPLAHLKTLPQTTTRKMQRTKDASAKKSPDRGLKVSSNQRTVLTAEVKRKPNPQMRPRRTSPVKKNPVAPEKTAPLQKTDASKVKIMGGKGPKRQPTSKPHGGSGQIQARLTATLASQLPMPKPTNRTAVSGRCTVPGKSSQFKPASSEISGGQRSTKPTAGIGKKAACQKLNPPGTFQNSRLRLPKTYSNLK